MVPLAGWAGIHWLAHLACTARTWHIGPTRRSLRHAPSPFSLADNVGSIRQSSPTPNRSRVARLPAREARRWDRACSERRTRSPRDFLGRPYIKRGRRFPSPCDPKIGTALPRTQLGERDLGPHRESLPPGARIEPGIFTAPR